MPAATGFKKNRFQVSDSRVLGSGSGFLRINPIYFYSTNVLKL
jgi:hypothetical protein